MLTRRLREVTDEFLVAQNGGGPDVLAEIKSPPLAVPLESPLGHQPRFVEVR